MKKVEIFISKWLKLAAKNRRANLTAPTVESRSMTSVMLLSPSYTYSIRQCNLCSTSTSVLQIPAVSSSVISVILLSPSDI
jgi:hypothetical protein